MTTFEGEAEFEQKLRHDLPRGAERRAQAAGRDRGLAARWLAPDEMTGRAWEHKEGGLLLGRRGGKVIGWNDNRHMLTIAGSRGGKGVSLIIPNLISYAGSAIVIDPKGENAARTAGQRGAGAKSGKKPLGQKVHVLDPYGESGLTSSSFNPLEHLDANSPDVVEDIGLFADALITHPEQGERHWTESAQALVRALILMVVADPMFDKRRNLVTVRRLLTLTDPAIDKVIRTDHKRRQCDAAVAAGVTPPFDEDEEDADDDGDNELDRNPAVPKVEKLTAEQALIKLLMDQCGTAYCYICNGMGAQLMSMAAKERGSVFSSARTQTQWLDSPAMPAVLEKSDFKLGELKTGKMTVYLCLPATRMATHARWLRLMVMLAIGVMERIKSNPELPVLFLLDEFAVLGYMQSIETAAGLMAGFGVKLWPILQNIGQLKRHYPHSWQTFVANAGCVTAFSVSDTETVTALSEFMGDTGIVSRVDSGASRSAQLQGAPSLREDRRQVPLLAPRELRYVFGRDMNRALVLAVEAEPAVVQRFIYHAEDGPDHDLFGGHYDPDPNYARQS